MLNLKNLMRMNATSCLLFGALFTLFPSEVATYLGGASPAPQLLILALGGALIINGLHLLWATTKPLPTKAIVLYFSAGDAIWVIATTGLLFSGLWITTTDGIITAIAVAVMVGFLGVMQMLKR